MITLLDSLAIETGSLTKDIYIDGGLKVVETEADLVNLDTATLRSGSLVFINATKKFKYATTSMGVVTWTLLDLGGSGTVGTAGLIPKGPWVSGPYPQNSVVTYQGSAYYASIAITTEEPNIDPAWVLLVAKGDAGVGGSGTSGTLTPKGAYSGTANYVAGDVVTSAGSSYYALTGTLAAPNVGNALVNASAWAVLSSRGPKGDGFRGRGNFNQSATSYLIGDVVSYLGSSYVATVAMATPSVAGTSVAVTVPGTDTNWAVLTTGVNPAGTWAASTAYNVGDVVTVGNKSYICKIANSDVTFTANKWILVASGLNFIGALSAQSYNVGDIVTFEGQSYICKTAIVSPAVAVVPATAGTPAVANWALLAAKGTSTSGTGTSGTLGVASKTWPGGSTLGLAALSFNKGDIVVVGSDTYYCNVAYPAVAILSGTAVPATPPTANWSKIATSASASAATAAIKTWTVGSITQTFSKGDIVIVGGNTYYYNGTAAYGPVANLGLPATPPVTGITQWVVITPANVAATLGAVKTWQTTTATAANTFTKGDIVIVGTDTYFYNGAAGYPTTSVTLPETPPTTWVKIATTTAGTSGTLGVASKTWPGGLTTGLAALFFNKGDIVVVGSDTYYCNVAYPAVAIASGSPVPATPPAANWSKISSSGVVRVWANGVVYNRGDIAVIGTDTYFWMGSTPYTVATGVTEPATTDISITKWRRIANATSVKAWANGTISPTSTIYNRGDLVIVSGDTFICNASQYPTAAQITAAGTYPATPPLNATTGWTKIAGSAALTVKAWSAAGYPFTPGCLTTYQGTTYIYTGTTNLTSTSNLVFTAAPVVAANSWQVFAAAGTAGQGITVKAALAAGSYAIGDIVTYNGGSYICKAAVTYSLIAGTPAGSLALPAAPAALPTSTWTLLAQSAAATTGFTIKTWAASNTYVKGDVVIVNNITYILTAATYTTPAAGSTAGTWNINTISGTGWTAISKPSGIRSWLATNVYSRGDMIRVSGDTYYFNGDSSATPVASFSTTVVQAGDITNGWVKIASQPQTIVYAAGATYTKGDIAVLGNVAWMYKGTGITVATPATGTQLAAPSGGDWTRISIGINPTITTYNPSGTAGSGTMYNAGDLVKASDGSIYICKARNEVISTSATTPAAASFSLLVPAPVTQVITPTAFDYKGVFNSLTTYTAGQVILLGGNTYEARKTTTAGTPPTGSTTDTSWALLSQGLNLRTIATAWVSNTTQYEVGDIVSTTNGKLWRCKQRNVASVVGGDPTTANSTYWELFIDPQPVRSSTVPASVIAGNIWYDTGKNALRVVTPSSGVSNTLATLEELYAPMDIDFYCTTEYAAGLLPDSTRLPCGGKILAKDFYVLKAGSTIKAQKFVSGVGGASLIIKVGRLNATSNVADLFTLNMSNGVANSGSIAATIPAAVTTEINKVINGAAVADYVKIPAGTFVSVVVNTTVQALNNFSVTISGYVKLV